MVTCVGESDLAAYLDAGDRILGLLHEYERRDDAALTSHRWLLDSPAKRLIQQRLYGDLIEERKGLRVLDVGGGYSSLTRALLAHHDYALLELFAHDDADRIREIEAELGPFWVGRDWHDWNGDAEYDIVVANDLFPNVDQRLALFLDEYLPRCRELRLSLTYYNRFRFYETKRVDADEVLFVVAWDGDQLARTLARFRDRFEGDLDELPARLDSIFPNGRQVAVAQLRGDL